MTQLILTVGARSSRLSQTQTQEVLSELREVHPGVQFESKFLKTKGDLDRATSLRDLGKTDFFTYEIDQMLLDGECRIAIHSAKDLPEPLAEGLKVIAITRGIDPSDSLVFPKETNLNAKSVIATSSERREALVRKVFPDVQFTDLRGTIEERLSQIDGKKIHGAVLAEAALIRLGLTHLHRIRLPGDTTPLQGQLAIVAREDDVEMQRLFISLDVRKKALYLGLDPSRFQTNREIIHYPVIEICPRSQRHLDMSLYTHVVFTSKTAVQLFSNMKELQDKTIIAIGPVTASFLKQRGIEAIVPRKSTQEGIIDLIDDLDMEDACVLFPRSSLSRPVLVEYFEKKGIRYQAEDLYDTVFKDQTPIDLQYVDEVVFTSPSTVDGFLKVYPTIAGHIQVTTIGPVTEGYCQILDRCLS